MHVKTWKMGTSGELTLLTEWLKLKYIKMIKNDKSFWSMWQQDGMYC
jgi:hypothetical protein